MISTRNIEKPIYSSGYVDYLRNGFNYDNETTKRQVRNQTINAVVSGTQAAVSIGATVGFGLIPQFNAINKVNRGISNLKNLIGEGPAAPNYEQLQREDFKKQGINIGTTTSIAAGVIGQGISAANSAINSLISIDSTKRQFAQTLQNNQVATAGLSSTADTDLLNSYADGNKLYLYNYSISGYDANNIAKVFYYCGYSHPVQEIPNTTSRLWFNFIQCNAVFNDEQTSVYTNYLNDIKTRLAAGVTVYHAVAGDYDWNQIKENYETWIPD